MPEAAGRFKHYRGPEMHHPHPGKRADWRRKSV